MCLSWVFLLTTQTEIGVSETVRQTEATSKLQGQEKPYVGSLMIIVTFRMLVM